MYDDVETVRDAAMTAIEAAALSLNNVADHRNTALNNLSVRISSLFRALPRIVRGVHDTKKLLPLQTLAGYLALLGMSRKRTSSKTNGEAVADDFTSMIDVDLACDSLRQSLEIDLDPFRVLEVHDQSQLLSVYESKKLVPNVSQIISDEQSRLRVSRRFRHFRNDRVFELLQEIAGLLPGVASPHAILYSLFASIDDAGFESGPDVMAGENCNNNVLCCPSKRCQ